MYTASNLCCALSTGGRQEDDHFGHKGSLSLAPGQISFSALRRVKNYLRMTMSQERLNYLMILHVHKDRTDAHDIKSILNEFVGDSEHRSRIFAKFLNVK